MQASFPSSVIFFFFFWSSKYYCYYILKNLLVIIIIIIINIKYGLITLRFMGPVWYMCLKTENCYLKIFMEIRVGEKVCENTYNVV